MARRMRPRHSLVLLALALGAVAIPAGPEPALAGVDSQVILEAKRATVGILREAERFQFQGTGVHIGDGYIVTARHVVTMQGADKAILPSVTILTQDLHELTAFLVGEHAPIDLAVYRVEAGAAWKLPGAVLFAASDPQAGEEVFTVGFPLDRGATVTYGRVGSEGTFLFTVPSRLLQLDLSVCSGNSGGGLFNDQGAVVGVIHAIIQTEQVQGKGGCSRMAFAIPATAAQRVARDLRERKRPLVPWLGIAMEAVKWESRWRVRIVKVEGPAFEGGLKVGDVILAIDQIEILTPAELKSFLLETAQPNQTVLLHILRGNTEFHMRVVLGEFSSG
ncbi:S1C family serine protease [Candidatus Nitrospira bockiana]